MGLFGFLKGKKKDGDEGATLPPVPAPEGVPSSIPADLPYFNFKQGGEDDIPMPPIDAEMDSLRDGEAQMDIAPRGVDIPALPKEADMETGNYIPPEFPPATFKTRNMPWQQPMQPSEPVLQPTPEKNLDFPEDQIEDLPDFLKGPIPAKPTTPMMPPVIHDKPQVTKEQKPSVPAPPQRIKPVITMTSKGQTLFVSDVAYKETLHNIQMIQRKLQEATSTLTTLEEMEHAKTKELDAWKTSIEDIQKKMVFVDKTLFEIES
ncbi:hypothetical protein HZB01_01235 [Candidatus Woesearchaeota archaeon]|nr:hypothetical protein [Candidatus Woesearchaeota archaeon]